VNSNIVPTAVNAADPQVHWVSAAISFAQLTSLPVVVLATEG
jgi:hypothetical protein